MHGAMQIAVTASQMEFQEDQVTSADAPRTEPSPRAVKARPGQGTDEPAPGAPFAADLEEEQLALNEAPAAVADPSQEPAAQPVQEAMPLQQAELTAAAEPTVTLDEVVGQALVPNLVMPAAGLDSAQIPEGAAETVAAVSTTIAPALPRTARNTTASTATSISAQSTAATTSEAAAASTVPDEATAQVTDAANDSAKAASSKTDQAAQTAEFLTPSKQAQASLAQQSAQAQPAPIRQQNGTSTARTKTTEAASQTQPDSRTQSAAPQSAASDAQVPAVDWAQMQKGVAEGGMPDAAEATGPVALKDLQRGNGLAEVRTVNGENSQTVESGTVPQAESRSTSDAGMTAVKPVSSPLGIAPASGLSANGLSTNGVSKPGVMATSAPAAMQDIQRAEILEQVRMHVSAARPEVTIILDPPALGEVHVRMTLVQGELHARVTARNAAVAEALQHDVRGLQSTLESAGLTVAQVDVRAQDDFSAARGGTDEGRATPQHTDREETPAQRARPEGAARPAQNPRTPSSARATERGLDVVI